MTVTASRLRRRSIAFAMLFVWMFALLSGLANACLAEPRGEPAHDLEHAVQADHRPHAAADEVGHDEQAVKAPCQKACGDSSQSLLKQLPKIDASDLQAAPLSIHAWAAGLHTAPAALVRAALAAIPPPKPPPRLQFSRLAL